MKLFILFLTCAVWQDIRTRKIRTGLLLIFGILGVLCCFLQGRLPVFILLSSAVGMGILFLGRISCGGIGAGDGWFFVISGLFLNPMENVMLFLSGLFFCGLFGLILLATAFIKGKLVRKLRVPFLPFLIPAGLWFLFL